MIKQFISFLFLLFCLLPDVKAQYKHYFTDNTLRFDYFRCGNSSEEYIYFDKMKEEGEWAGSKNHTIDNLNYGNSYVKLFDTTSGELIYSRGYCTLFLEWRYTPEANSISRCYPESVSVPFPKNKSRLEIHNRDKDGNFSKVFSYDIDPDNKFIRRDFIKTEPFDVMIRGKPSQSVDIVLVSEGYADNEKAKFEKDCAYFANEMFQYSPYKENQNKFNIRAVWIPSSDTGISIPGDSLWCRTALGSKFYTFDSERYLMVDDFHTVKDAVAKVPYDYIYILANTEKYGGGGIYNFHGISAAAYPKNSGKIYIHEFGHLFLGLGDEYIGNVKCNDFYKTNREPWEENLTSLVDFEKKDWYRMLDKNIEIPTPINDENKNTIGVYEGGGYVSKGIYRPYINCLMNSLHNTDEFCPVCQSAILKMIDFHCK